MKEEQFQSFMDHFVKFTRPSKKSPFPFLLDNCSAHLSIDIIKYANENGVVCLSFPPHTSYRLQLFDVSVYSSLKTNEALAQDCWVKNHPDKVMTIYDLPNIAKKLC